MTNPNVIARHARNAIGILADGVISNIAAAFADKVANDGKETAACVTAIDEMTDRLLAFGYPAWINRADSMISDMHALLADPNCPIIIRELLAQYDLNP